LIDASVWIAPPIWNSVSDGIERSVAEITPTESDWRSPNGLPMAAVGSPTSTSSSGPISSGLSDRSSGSTSSSATSANGSNPTIVASILFWSVNWTNTASASLISGPPSAWPSVTTWALVTISPSSEITKPEPCPAWGPVPSGFAPSGRIELTVTTLGAALS
jgi:hypothetical protein